MLDVDLFLRAQDYGDPVPYRDALAEIRAGRKDSHWIWYVFPQLASLGKSQKAVMYGIKNLEDAKTYLDHPVLRERLEKISAALLELPTADPHQVMDIWPDSHTDTRKLFSSMTLFSRADGRSDSVYVQVLNKFFDGEEDRRTLSALREDEDTGMIDISGQFRFNVSDEEKEEYYRSFFNLGVRVPYDYPGGLKAVSFTQLPEALYFVVPETEARSIQQTGLFLAGLDDGKNDKRKTYFLCPVTGDKLAHRLVFTRGRMGARAGFVRIKVSLRRYRKKCLRDMSTYDWNNLVRSFRFLLSDHNAIVFCDSVRIEPQFCFLLDPVCYPPRSAKEYPGGIEHLFRAFNREKYRDSKIWDNVCHLVITNDLRKLDDVSFCECENLETVQIDDTVEYLGCDSFSRCRKLHSVTIGSSVKDCANRVFCDNPCLSYVCVDASLKTEFRRAALHGDRFGYASWFSNCPKLRSICFTDGTNIPFSPRNLSRNR